LRFFAIDYKYSQDIIKTKFEKVKNLSFNRRGGGGGTLNFLNSLVCRSYNTGAGKGLA